MLRSVRVASRRPIGVASTRCYSDMPVLPPTPLEPISSYYVKDMSIIDYSPSKHSPISIGNSFSLPRTFTPTLPKNLAFQFDLGKNPSILYRKCIHDITELVKAGSDRTIFVEGKRGFGKSTTLVQLANHFLQTEFIVVFLPGIDTWVSGIYAFEKQADGLYAQPHLARQILDEIVTLNSKKFAKMAGPNGKSMAEYVKNSDASATLAGLIEHLSTPAADR
jgi:Mitochondrial ribosomal death-associated protein 3